MRLETLSGVKGLYPASRATRFTGGGDFIETFCLLKNALERVALRHSRSMPLMRSVAGIESCRRDFFVHALGPVGEGCMEI